jgi:hypothetical protein
MQIWTFVITGLAIGCAAQSALAEPVAQRSDDQRGRYEGIAASDNAVWVVDTATGQVRKCTQEFADQAPACTGMSN